MGEQRFKAVDEFMDSQDKEREDFETWAKVRDKLRKQQQEVENVCFE